jgi:hypothetical protein
MAHAEAEDIVLERLLTRVAPPPQVRRLIAVGRTAHLEQERALGSLLCAVPGTTQWRERALHLLELVERHAGQEETELAAALPRWVPSDVFHGLAGAFATERMRQLAMLQPSGPIAVPPELQAIA